VVEVLCSSEIKSWDKRLHHWASRSRRLKPVLWPQLQGSKGPRRIMVYFKFKYQTLLEELRSLTLDTSRSQESSSLHRKDGTETLTWNSLIKHHVKCNIQGCRRIFGVFLDVRCEMEVMVSCRNAYPTCIHCVGNWVAKKNLMAGRKYCLSEVEDLKYASVSCVIYAGACRCATSGSHM